MSCAHDRAYPAVDSSTGWRCPDCDHASVPEPLRFKAGDLVEILCLIPRSSRLDWIPGTVTAVTSDRFLPYIVSDGSDDRQLSATSVRAVKNADPTPVDPPPVDVYGNKPPDRELPPFIAPPWKSRQNLEKLKRGDVIGILVEARGLALWTFGTIVKVDFNSVYPFKVKTDWGEGERVMDFPWCSVREFPFHAAETGHAGDAPPPGAGKISEPLADGVYGSVSENQAIAPVIPKSSVNSTTKPKSFRKRRKPQQLSLLGCSSSIDLSISQEIYRVPSHGRHYWRYVARLGRTVLYSLHVPGGACGNLSADRNAEQIRNLIKQGKQPNQVVEAIAKYKNCPT